MWRNECNLLIINNLQNYHICRRGQKNTKTRFGWLTWGSTPKNAIWRGSRVGGGLSPATHIYLFIYFRPHQTYIFLYIFLPHQTHIFSTTYLYHTHIFTSHRHIIIALPIPGGVWFLRLSPGGSKKQKAPPCSLLLGTGRSLIGIWKLAENNRYPTPQYILGGWR